MKKNTLLCPSMSNKPCIGITVGDFNGIGPELILKTLSNELIFNYCTPIVYANTYIFKHYAELLELPAINFNIVRQAKDVKHGMVNLRSCSSERLEITPGTPSVQAGKLAYDALQLAVEDIKSGIIENILTAPIDKKTTTEAGLAFNGHTQYFAEEFGSSVQMILLNDQLRVAMVTGHNALSEVAAKITTESVLEQIETLSANLQADFGISKPKIAVLGMNPHGGDNGLMGSEELESIKPAIKQAQEKGILAIGPYPPDGFFGSKNSQNFDGVLGMYHDQVLIPFKQVAFADGINYTAGLPMIRTSPDHGTAYDIAGKGIADASSFINALYLINKIHRNRLAFYDQSVSTLNFREHRREKFSIGVPDLR
jgi:4-hydroxythreonine-4-phosphate dehydrogenase|tara:strand:+ start:2901 stop:4007 length:1107 start_codon:yes stop_codon:yes gene_type:complete